MDSNFDSIRENLAASIKGLRQAKGLSQESLALSANVDRTYVSQIERGVGNPSLLILSRLAQVLQVRLPSLLNGVKAGDGELPSNGA